MAEGSGVGAWGPPSAYLIDEDDARLLRARHLEELTHHARALSDVLLHELRADDADEARVGAVGDRARRKRFAGAGRAVEQHALWRVDAQLHEALGVEHWQLEHLAQLLDLILVPSDVVVGDVGLGVGGRAGGGQGGCGWMGTR